MRGPPSRRYVPAVSDSEGWPRWADPAIAGAVATVAVVQLALAAGPPPVTAYVLAVGMALPLAARRRAPVTVLLAVMGMLTAHAVLDQPAEWLYVPLTIFLAFYGAGAHRPLRPATAGLAGGLALLGVETWLNDLPFSEFAYPGMLCTACWAAGAALRARIAAAAEALTRARLAEESQEHAAQAAVAEERARIARELHDVVSHSVTVMVMQAGALRRRLPGGYPQETELACTIERTGREALGELRRMLGLLRTDAADNAPLAPQPGLQRLGELVAVTEAAGVPVVLSAADPPEPLPPGLALCVYRLVQESLTNVVRHAGPAASARVSVSYRAGEVDVEVCDDGRGGSPSADGSGHGMLGMRERVTLFGGRFSAGPGPAGGFRVWAALPLDSR
jgi:signal transduction histidine kinase